MPPHDFEIVDGPLSARATGPGRQVGVSRPGGPVMVDPLCDVLRAVRLDGAFFRAVEAREPWSVETLAARDLTPRILPGVEHLIPYHILTAGRCWGGLIGEPPVALEPGDVILFPHGDAHVMSSDPELQMESVLATPGHYPETMTVGDGVRVTATLVCGFLGCDRRPFIPLLSTLPRRLHLPGLSSGWLQSFARQVVEESRARRAGADSVLTRLAELMFVEVLRRYIETLPSGQHGWLAGLRDNAVGRGLGLLHGAPAHPWTLDELARGVAMSRSAFVERFTALVGQPPMQYLAQWRMQLAAARLETDTAKVAAIAEKVGYDSEVAFSRAFKRLMGVSPAAWRRARVERGERRGEGRRSSEVALVAPRQSVPARGLSVPLGRGAAAASSDFASHSSRRTGGPPSSLSRRPLSSVGTANGFDSLGASGPDYAPRIVRRPTSGSRT